MTACRLKKVALGALVLAWMAAPTLSFASGGGGEKSGGDAHGKKPDHSETKSKKNEVTSITGGTGADDPIYLHLAPLNFPIIDAKGAQQIVSIIIDVNVADRPVGEKMQANMPVLKDAILTALYGGVADGSLMAAPHMLDMPKIKAKVLETCNKLYGPGTAQNVLIQAFTQRKL